MDGPRAVPKPILAVPGPAHAPSPRRRNGFDTGGGHAL